MQHPGGEIVQPCLNTLKLAKTRKSHSDETIIEQFTHEIAILKQHKFDKRSEQFSPAQDSLPDDLLNTELKAIEAELKVLHPTPAQTEPRQQTTTRKKPDDFTGHLLFNEFGRPLRELQEIKSAKKSNKRA